MKVLLLIVFFLHGAIISADNQFNENFFSNDEINSFNASNFEIISGKIILNPIGGFADGEYILENTNIKQIKQNAYIIDLTFIKKKKSFKYKHHETIALMEDGKKVWIKYKGQVYKYFITQPTQYIKKEMNSITKSIKRASLDIVIENIELQILFLD